MIYRSCVSNKRMEGEMQKPSLTLIMPFFHLFTNNLYQVDFLYKLYI